MGIRKIFTENIGGESAELEVYHDGEYSIVLNIERGGSESYFYFDEQTAIKFSKELRVAISELKNRLNEDKNG